MQLSRSFRLLLCALLIAFVTSVCSSGYITPGSLASTQQAVEAGRATASAFVPTQTPSEVPTASATPLALPTATAVGPASPAAPYVYTAQSGDTLASLAVHFGVEVSEIASPQDLPPGLINPGQIFTIPNVLGATGPSERLMPDSEVVFSPSAIGFKTAEFTDPFAGYIATYRQYLPSEWHTGAQVVERVALENSLNPRLLLSVLQYQSNWVLGEPKAGTDLDYPIGYKVPREHGLYAQLTWAAKQLLTGYYDWREGRLTDLVFRDGTRLRVAPDLNAGTVAIQYLFSQLYSYEDWLEVIDKNTGYPFTHTAMFPDPWVRAAQTEPLFPPNLSQPALSLPFFGNQIWYFTAGPHGAWEREGSMAALDFAPSSLLPGCTASDYWVAAAAPGLVVRSAPGIVVVDMDGDANEQTGWVIIYLHVSHGAVAHVGDFVNRGDKLGHPSCEGGTATGTHLHIVRKYNGEWIAAGGPVPFEMSGWVTQNGAAAYLGGLVRDDRIIVACTCSGTNSLISHSPDDPY